MSNTSSKKEKNRPITLIELLIAIALIALIGGVVAVLLSRRIISRSEWRLNLIQWIASC